MEKNRVGIIINLKLNLEKISIPFYFTQTY